MTAAIIVVPMYQGPIERAAEVPEPASYKVAVFVDGRMQWSQQGYVTEWAAREAAAAWIVQSLDEPLWPATIPRRTTP